MKMDILKKKCTTPKFRVSFPNVFEPKSFQDQKAKYSITMLFSDDADLDELKRAVENATIEMWGENKAKWPKNLRTPFRDGNEKSELQGYAGMTYVSASSRTKPGLVDQAREDILKDDLDDKGNPRFYAGCYARATLIAFAYDEAGNKGVSFSLQNIQKLRDGKPFSGKKAARDEFEAVEDESNDASNYGSDEETEESSVGF